MGKVMETIKLTNDYDFASAQAGSFDPRKVRTLEIEALVDTGATLLMLRADVVERLGLPTRGHRKVRYADARVEEVPWVVGVKLEIRGREAVVSAPVGPIGSMPLIGQIPLEEMDFVVDSKSRELRPNPASPDAPVLDLLGAA
jgi:clan AA aspartic protease